MGNCRPNIPDFVSTDCIFESGRVVAIALIHKDIHASIYANPSDPSVWVDGNYSADLHIFTEVRGTYTATPTEIPGLGKQSTREINMEHVLTADIEGVKGNEDFWNEIRKSNNYRLAWVVGGDYNILKIQNKDISIGVTDPVEEGLDTEYIWKSVYKWRDFNVAKSSDVPSNIFE